MANEQQVDQPASQELKNDQTDKSDETGLPQEKPISIPVIAPVGITLGLAVTIALLSSLITVGSMLVAYDYFIAQKIVSVDLKGFIANTRDEYVSGKINEVQMRAGFDRMEAVVKRIGKNKVVLMGDAVIQGVPKIEIGPNLPIQPSNP